MGQLQCCAVEKVDEAALLDNLMDEGNHEMEQGPNLLTAKSSHRSQKSILDEEKPAREESKFLMDDKALCAKEEYAMGRLSIVVLGGTGDLATKKTFPALIDLFHNSLLPQHVCIVGYGRSELTTEAFRAKLRPALLKVKAASVVDAFLSRLSYCQGQYDSPKDFLQLNNNLQALEGAMSVVRQTQTMRIFYFALPPDAFLGAAKSIKMSAMCGGTNKLIVEKPFGRDLKSAKQLASDLEALFHEDSIYRIDHYLGKEIVQNLMYFRFGNRFLEPLLNRDHVASVRITFKEDFGTEGRGGYFTNYGIIRDVIQNHLMQVLSLLAMEAPKTLSGPKAGNDIRDAKVAAVKAIRAINPKEVVIGQYVGAGGKPGYLDDDSIKDKGSAEFVPTFAAMVLRVNTSRWKGVPFHVKAGKALDERKAEVRIQFKDAARYNQLFGRQEGARNELVMRLHPSEAIYMKVDIKDPGMNLNPIQTELDLTYKERYPNNYNPDAYTRLVLDALKGKQEHFVRTDELLCSWKLFDPLLQTLEKNGKQRRPIPYSYGSRGPEEADHLFANTGFEYVEGAYDWKE